MKSDTRLGYIVISGILLFSATLCVYIGISANFPADKRVIAFSQLPNLRIDDLVTVNGGAIGSIKNIILDHEQQEGRAIATIVTHKKLELHEGYSITTVDKGIMGERVISILCGDPSRPLISAADTLVGTFSPGISEAIGFAWKLKAEVKRFREISDTFALGSATKKSFSKSFNEVFDAIDSLSNSLHGWVKLADATVPPVVNTTQKLLSQTQTIMTKADSFATSQIPAVEGSLDTLSRYMHNLQMQVATIEPILDSLKEYHGTQRDSLEANLAQAISLVQELLHFIRYNFNFPARLVH